MIGFGFAQSGLNPCLHFQTERGIRVLVHVDDFLCTGTESNLIVLKEEFDKHFEIKHRMLGMRSNPVGELTFLGRSIRWKCHGIEIEVDTKHLKALLK